MAAFLHETIVDLRKRPPIEYIGYAMYTGDALADTLKISVLDGGNPAEISGTVVAKIVRPDNMTVPAQGSIAGNIITVALPASAYVLPGNIRITVKLAENDWITSIYGAVATITLSETEAMIDPGDIIPSVEALIAEIESVRRSIPEDYSTLAAQVRTNASNINGVTAKADQNTDDIGNLQTTVQAQSQNIGSLSGLITPTKTNLVQAINEAYEYDPSAAYDDTLSATSENAVQNKVIKQALDAKMNTPASGGTAGQCLMSDGAGSLVWGTPSDTTVVLGDLALKDRVVADFTPHGTVSAPTVDVNTTKIARYVTTSPSGGGAVTPGTAAACNLPELTATLNGKNLILSWTPGSFTPNAPTEVTLPRFQQHTLVTGVSATASAPVFTGTQEEIVST